ncbi:MAG: radical SAM protein [Candidatus Riflebacteria bacterium]|nr:radical SAM protein [Candidatus Riflebacteria bacterium]
MIGSWLSSLFYSTFPQTFAKTASLSCSSRFVLQWHLTDACNLRCRHCYESDAGKNVIARDRFFASLRQCHQLVSNLQRNHPEVSLRCELRLTGGEPLLHPDFFDLLECCGNESSWLDISILTNGTLVTPAIARRIAVAKPLYVQVSIDGAEAMHDGIRGKGSFAAAANGISSMRALDIPVSLAFTAHRANTSDISTVAEFAAKVGVRRIWADRMIPAGRGSAFENELLSPEETRSFFQLMRHSCDEIHTRYGRNTDMSFHRALQFHEGRGKPYRCSAGRSLLTVLADGTIVPCRRLPVPCGSIEDNGLFNAFHDNPFIRSLREFRGPARGCEECLYQGLCEGGLRCLSYAIHGDPFRADPGCWIAHHSPGKQSEAHIIPAITVPPMRYYPAKSSCLPTDRH